MAALVTLPLWAPLAFAADGPPVNVTRAVEQAIVQVVRMSGTVTSPRSAVLSPSVAGLVERMDVDAGDRVDAGDVVVVLDKELAALALERSEAELAQARTAFADSRRRLAEAESVGATRAIAESAIKSLASEVQRDEAALRAAAAAVKEQRAILARHDVAAPFAGAVSERIAETGEWVNPGDALVELVALEGLRFDFRVPQEHYGSVRDDTPVVLQSGAVPGFSAAGRIQAVVPVKNPGARTFLLRVVANDGADISAMTPGMSTRGSLKIDTGRRAVVVPRDALLRYPDGRQVVWVVDTSTELPKARERVVETGLFFEGLVEISSGLEAGVLVVTRGNETLQDGQTVTIL